MSKILTIAHTTYQEYLEYRLNFTLWRLRTLLMFLTLVFFWLAVYGDSNSFAGYTKDQMLTYIVAAAFLRALIFGTRTGSIASEIREGSLTRLITKPISPFLFWAARDIADKAMNLAFAIVEIAIVVFLLKIHLYFPTNFTDLVLSLTMVILATILYFYISLALSFAAFWTDDIWAMLFLFGYIFLEFFSGSIFPLDVLPQALTNILNYTPFPYMLYYPIKIWLGQISLQDSIQALFITSIWIVATYIFVLIVWKRGTKNYGAYGG